MVSPARQSRPTLLFAVHHAGIGGAQLAALDEARHLARRHDLIIAVAPGPLMQDFARCGVRRRACPNLPFGGAASRRRWALQLARSVLDGVRVAWLARRRGVDLVLTNTSITLGPLIGARLAGVPSIVHVRETAEHTLERVAQRVAARLADVVVPVSSYVAAQLDAPSSAHVVVAHDGVVIPTERPAPPDFGSPPLRLALVGTINGDGYKGQDIAIDALAELTRRGLDARLDLVGPIHGVEHGDALRARASAAGIADRVRLTGAQDHMDEVYEDTDIVLSCSRHEALGLTLMEALTHVRPVVASSVGGIPEIVTDGRTGVLVAPERPDAVADAIMGLLRDPARAQAMASRGRDDVERRFDKRASLRRLEAIIHTATARKHVT